jgi:hypothetical protein
MGVGLSRVEVSVTLALEGDPVFATGIEVRVRCETAHGSDPGPVIERAKAITMVGNGLNRGVPVTIRDTSRR